MGWAILICLGFSVGAFNGGAWPIGLLFAAAAIICFLAWLADDDTDATPQPEPVHVPTPAEQLEAARAEMATQLEAARAEAHARAEARRAEAVAQAERIAAAARARATAGDGWE
jgi:hypothetical protein